MATRERERRERQLTPLEVFAASRISGRRGEGGGGKYNNPFDMAMEVLGMQEKREQKEREWELNERQQAALETHQQDLLGISRAKEAREERESAESAAERKTERETGTTRYIQSRMDAADALAREAEKQRLDQEYKNKALETERFRRLVETGVVPSTIEQNGRLVPNPMLQKMYEKIDPTFADVSAQVANEQNQAKFAALEKTKAIAEAAKKPTYVEPNAPRPTGTTPSAGAQIMSPEGIRISDIFAPKVTVDPELRSGRTRPTPQTQPTQPPEFAYEEGYPSAQPNYMYGIPTPDASDIINKYEADPRFKTAEQDLYEWFKGLMQNKAPEVQSTGIGWQQ